MSALLVLRNSCFLTSFFLSPDDDDVFFSKIRYGGLLRLGDVSFLAPPLPPTPPPLLLLLLSSNSRLKRLPTGDLLAGCCCGCLPPPPPLPLLLLLPPLKLAPPRLFL